MKMVKKISNLPKKHQSFQYEMSKRKEKWKSINDPIERKLAVPPEHQPQVVEGLVSDQCYACLVPLLKLPEFELPCESNSESSIDTIIPYVPYEDSSTDLEVKDSLKTLPSYQSSQSESTSSVSQHESLVASVSKTSEVSVKTETKETSIAESIYSDTVEVEQQHSIDHETIMKHKAILKFLTSSEAEAATWRKKDKKDVTDISEMTLEEQGDFLINKIAADFCEWIRELGGDEKSFISEEIVKELFQIGMDNPASRSICMKTEEKRVLYYSLAQFLHVPEKSFHEVLSKHLNWDAKIEKLKSRKIAFGECLPKYLRFISPENNTSETWLEWNKLSDEQLSFADVYKDIKDLRSTKEYCKWMLDHPEHKRPQYLVDQRMFDESMIDHSPRLTFNDVDWESA